MPAGADLLSALAEKLGIEISRLPVAGSAPEFITEKAISIGSFFLAAGLLVHVAPPPRIFGSPYALDLLTAKLPGITGGRALVETDPIKAAAGIIEHIRSRRSDLGLA